MNRNLRHQKILDLVRTRSISSQDQLRELLSREGISVTQSTLSRDVKELELVKGRRGYQLPEESASQDSQRLLRRLQAAILQYLLSCTAARNLVVLRTPAGHAHPLALALDSGALDGVLGTVAGDDTVLLVAENDGDARRLAADILALAESAPAADRRTADRTTPESDRSR
jgi:transcriptional regulator of arginine metabolism